MGYFDEYVTRARQQAEAGQDVGTPTLGECAAAIASLSKSNLKNQTSVYISYN